MRTIKARESSGQSKGMRVLLASRRLPFSKAQERLDDGRSRRADLNARVAGVRSGTMESGLVSQRARSLEQRIDEIDEGLHNEAWKLVSQPAISFEELRIKARYVQEFTPTDETDLESQIVLSLCRDLLALTNLLAIASVDGTVDQKVRNNDR